VASKSMRSPFTVVTPRGEFCLFGRARQGVNLGTLLGEIGHDLGAPITPVLPVTRMVMVMLLAT
jgi:hypothetical protein